MTADVISFVLHLTAAIVLVVLALGGIGALLGAISMRFRR